MDLIRIETRGIAGALVVGTQVVVESFEAGVLTLRMAPVAKVLKADPVPAALLSPTKDK